MNLRTTAASSWIALALAGLVAPACAQAPSDLTQAPEVLADTSKLALGEWALDLRFGLGLAQSAYSNNWKTGDKGSIAWISNLDFEAERQFTPVFNWYNVAKLAYGETASQIDDPDQPGENKWAKPEKTTDLIYLESVGRFSFGGFVDPYAAFRLDSFFSDQSDPAGSILFNPLTLKESAGMARVFYKTEKKSLVSRLGFGFRQNIGRFFVDSLGVDTETNTANDGGIEFQTDMKQPVFGEKSLFESQLLVFAPLFYSQASALEEFDAIAQGADPTRESVGDFWKSPNATWRNRLLTKLTKVVSFDLYVELVYQKFDPATRVDTSLPPGTLIPIVDSGVTKGVQIRQTFTFGLSLDVL